jgi:alanine-alpha-ketoisovalerate/valine-pyruvate aminotransferase
MLKQLFYVKNVPSWERFARSIAGIAMIACGLLGLPGLTIGYVVAASGLITMLTGLVGFCPMCAMAGRKIQATLKNRDKQG